MHLDADQAVAAACLTPPALHVEREPPGTVATHPRLGQHREQVTDVREQARVCSGIRTRRSTDRRLVDIDDFIDLFDPGNLVGLTRRELSTVQSGRERSIERIHYQRALPGPGHAGHTCHLSKREFHVDGAQVVVPGADDANRPAAARPALGRYGNLRASGEKRTCERRLVRDHLLGRAGRDDPTSFTSRARAHVDHVIRAQDGIRVVLDDKHGVAASAKVLQTLEQLFVVTRMQPD